MAFVSGINTRKTGFATKRSIGGIAPSNTVAPLLSGEMILGTLLSCTTGTWTGTLPITYTYQWKRDSVDISGATNSTYTVTISDLGTVLTCLVTATNSFGVASQLSSNSIAYQPQCSYYFDAINHYINFGDILDSTLSGVSPVFSIRIVVKFNNTGVNEPMFCKRANLVNERGIFIRRQPTGEIRCFFSEDGNTEWVAQTSQQFTSTTEFYDIFVTYNGAAVGLAKVNVIVNGIASTMVLISGTITSGIRNNASSLVYGFFTSTTVYMSGYINQVGITSDVISSSEALLAYNSGSPLILSSFADNIQQDCIFDDDVFGGVNWTVIDSSVNSLNGSTVNMGLIDKDCNENPY